MLKLLTTMIVVLTSYATLACDGGMFPSITYGVSPDKQVGGLSKEEFLATIANFENKLSPWVEDHHEHELIVFKSWGSNAINAYAERSRGKMMISVNGGLARYESLTVDGFSLTLCHELGHHLGGYPKKSTNTWSSAEGQADYWGTLKCLRRLWEGEDHRAAVAQLNVPSYLQERCAGAWSGADEQALCVRMGMAGKSMALLFQYLDHESFEPEFHTPDPDVVRAMMYIHPWPQCRLDTYFQGALCTRPYDEDMDDDDALVSTCHQRLGHQEGLRPACWFVGR